MAGKYDIKINQGEDYYQLIQWLMGDQVTPVNLTGYTGRCQIRSTAKSGIMATVHVDIVDAAAGKIALSLSAAETSAIPATGDNYSKMAEYAYDVEFVGPTGTVYRLLNGIVYVSPEVTR